MIIKKSINKCICTLIILCISVFTMVDYVKAELTRNKNGAYFEKPISYDIENDYEGFYKNFIIELGGIRIALYDSIGNELWKFDILPKQFESKAPIYEIETDFIKSPESIFLSYIYKLDLSKFKFSDNIPRLTQYEDENQKEIS